MDRPQSLTAAASNASEERNYPVYSMRRVGRPGEVRTHDHSIKSRLIAIEVFTDRLTVHAPFRASALWGDQQESDGSETLPWVK